jgi:aerobic-type carbon monoxide dehydrogenase small subunit (CoxS/CutS family)
MSQQIQLHVNGVEHTIDADPEMPLLYALRDDLGLSNPRFGCGLAQCGACTVIVDGAAGRSCTISVKDVVGRKITTLNGLGAPDKPHKVQAAFIEEQALHCGYCLNGWIMTTVALLDANPHPSDEQIRGALTGLKCRCGAHSAIFRAVKRAAQV